MRRIYAADITQAVKTLCLEANWYIGKDVINALKQASSQEDSAIGCDVLEQIIKNDEIAASESVPVCQDTGMVVVFAEVGQDVRIEAGNYSEAIQEGVRQAYVEGYLRKSIVRDPLFDRSNTKDNTPAVIYTDIVPGDRIKLKLTVKGFGSENMSRTKMMTPAEGIAGFKDFVLETVRLAGPNPCPPIVVGIGVGGTMDKAAQLAKIATMREIGVANANPNYADLEQQLHEAINQLGIGPAGLGGRSTALAVHIEYYPGHIAGIPVVVNICCHAARHKETVI
jgi:fumarate hydratase subunit alpha